MYEVNKHALIHIMRVPVPPMLDLALGYEGDRRYVGLLNLEPKKGQLISDGSQYLKRASSAGWELYSKYPTVKKYLKPYRRTDYGILLDRESTILYAAKCSDIEKLLDEQHRFYKGRRNNDSTAINSDKSMGPSNSDTNSARMMDSSIHRQLLIWLDRNRDFSMAPDGAGTV